MRMPFGKYVDWQLSEIPVGYLHWTLENLDLHEPLRSAVEDELNTRGHESWNRYCQSGSYRNGHHASNENSGLVIVEAERPIVRSLVEAGYRVLALKAHPDVGGSTAQMRTLNRVIASLRRGLS